MKLENYFKRRGYVLDDFLHAIKSSTSIAQALIKLNIVPAGGNYQSFNKLTLKLNIDTSHFVGQAHNRGKNLGPRRPLSDYICKGVNITSDRLRIRLLQDGVFNHECCICKLTTWNNKPIPLELDHIDGNHSNNRLENIRLLCPNCHAQTDTYRGRNKRILVRGSKS